MPTDPMDHSGGGGRYTPPSRPHPDNASYHSSPHYAQHDINDSHQTNFTNPHDSAPYSNPYEAHRQPHSSSPSGGGSYTRPSQPGLRQRSGDR